MFHFGRQAGLPMEYYINNGDLAEEVMQLMLLNKAKTPESKISHVKELVMKHDLSFVGQPTFARAVIELIEKINTKPMDKLNLISDIAKITIALKQMKLVST